MKGIMKQVTSIKWWGRLKYILTQLAFYTTMFVLFFSAISAYTTGISPWLQDHGLSVPFWAFLIGVGVILTLAVVFEYKVTLPGFHSVWNEQWWRHDNPMRQELEEIKREIKILKGLVKNK